MLHNSGQKLGMDFIFHRKISSFNELCTIIDDKGGEKLHAEQRAIIYRILVGASVEEINGNCTADS